MKTTYYWEQTFAPGETTIEHRYAPSVGVTLGTLVGSDIVDGLRRQSKLDEGDRNTIAEFEQHVKTYCIDDEIIRSARAIHENAKKVGPLIEQRIAYVLKTAANWSGPIADFRLVVDKQYPDNLVSFCGSGVRKIGPTKFEMTRRGFVPSDNLAILFLTTHVEN